MNRRNLDIQDKILLAALEDVPFEGWSWPLVQQAALRIGSEPEMADAVFIEKLPGILDHFSDWADRQMLAALADIDGDAMRVRDRIQRAVQIRLGFLEPHREAVRASLGYWARPLRKYRAAKNIWKTADHIWHWAGDRSTDYNHYTKRILLSGILTSTMLVWLNDQSHANGDTDMFLTRQIENVLKLGQFTGTINRVIKKEA